jgi:valyl-tRNA synthetase
VNFAGTCSGFDIISSCIVDLPIWIIPKSSEVLFIERYGNFDIDDSLITFDAFESRVIFAFVIVTFASLGKASEVHVQADHTGIGEDAVSVHLAEADVYIPLEELVDKEKELQRLENEKKRLEGELKRSAGMLNNPNFVSKAPEAKIAQEKEKQAKYAAQMEKVLAQIEKIKG